MSYQQHTFAHPLLGLRALVCGSTQGIGLACATLLARAGASVTLAARRQDALDQTRDSLDASHQQQHDTLTADFADPAQVRDAVQNALRHNPRYDILINNTGGPSPGPLLDADPQQFLNAINQHVIVNQILAQLLVPGMKDRNYGRIINIISTSVKIPIAGLGVSNTTRAAVANWAKTLANELAPFGITVNNVLPGMTDTQRLRQLVNNKAAKASVSAAEMEQQMKGEIPAARFGTAEEIAAAVLFLASPAASYVTGINLPVDGGRTGCL